MNRFLRVIWLFLAANIGTICAVESLRNPDPLQNLSVTAQYDGLILFGKNQHGLNSYKVFKNWKELQKYIVTYDLFIQPSRNDFQRKPAQEVTYSRTSDGKFRLSWGKLQLEDREVPLVIFAPDEMSAKFFLDYINHNSISHSKLGFAVNFEN